MHLVRMRTMARNRIHGVLTQWGLKIPVTRLRAPDGLELSLRCRRAARESGRTVSACAGSPARPACNGAAATGVRPDDLQLVSRLDENHVRSELPTQPERGHGGREQVRAYWAAVL